MKRLFSALSTPTKTICTVRKYSHWELQQWPNVSTADLQLSYMTVVYRYACSVLRRGRVNATSETLMAPEQLQAASGQTI